MNFGGLHVVTDDRLGGAALLEVVDGAVDGGAAVVQVRAKTADAREFTATVRAVSEVVRGRALLIVNDRVDVALAARHAGSRVDGVHLGQDDLDPTIARALLGPGAVIGWTAHTAEHLASLAPLHPGTVDYLGVGLVRATSSKPDAPPVLGVAGFGAFAEAAPLPCIAIGGVRATDVPALRATGAAGVAVVSAVCGADDPRSAAREFVDAMSKESTR